MTDKLKQEAKEWCKSKNLTPSNVGYFTAEYCEMAYIAGATENGIQWHDLRKDPNDLPPKLDKYSNCSDCLYVQYGGKYGNTDFAYYNFIENKWQRYENAENAKDKVIAWCEIPQFKKSIDKNCIATLGDYMECDYDDAD